MPPRGDQLQGALLQGSHGGQHGKYSTLGETSRATPLAANGMVVSISVRVFFGV